MSEVVGKRHPGRRLIRPAGRATTPIALSLLAVVLLLAGCRPVDDQGVAGTPTSPGPGAAAVPGPVPQHPGGVVEPPMPPDDPPSFTTARLPIGREGVDETCVAVSYLGNTDIPPGVQLKITGATFDPAVYEAGGDGCDDWSEQPCLGAGFAFTAENRGEDDGTCVVPLRPVGFSDQVRLEMTGTIDCPEGARAECMRFADDLSREYKSVQFPGPEAPADPPVDPPNGDPPVDPPDGDPPVDAPPVDAPPADDPPADDPPADDPPAGDGV